MLDKVARGTAVKDFLVVPRRFQGKRVQALNRIEVPGYSDGTFELYFVSDDDERRGVVSLYAGGTVVSEDLGSIDGYDLDPSIWSSGKLEGIIDFPDLEVAPTTRREFVRNPAADCLFDALRSVEPVLRDILAKHEEKRQIEEDENVAQEIRRIFRPLTENLPQYDFFDIGRDNGTNGEEASAAPPPEGAKVGRREDGAVVESGEEAPASTEVVESGDEPEPPEELFPPGPLASVRIVPRKCRLLPGATRSLRAKAVDETGRVIPSGISFSWSVVSGEGILQGDEDKATFTAPPEIGPVRVAVRAEDRIAGAASEAEAEIQVVEKLRGENPDAGIPDPKRVFDPKGDWRSRLAGPRWEYNAAHPDYQSVVEEPKRRLRYLTHLFAKEIVLRNYGEPTDERLLERMVEVLTYIKRGV